MPIVISPELQKSQASQMEQLMAEYDSLFGNVTATLNSVNRNWSDNLSHNFSSKLISAQRSFSVIVDSLQVGVDAANSSANTFEDIDSVLSKSMTPDLFGPGILPYAAPVIGPAPGTSDGMSPDLLFQTSGESGSASASTDWLGYEFADGHPGVTAWCGKASAEFSNDQASGSVNAYLGKATAEIKAKANFMERVHKTEFKNGKWTEKDTLSFVNVELGGNATFSALAADAQGKIGDDSLGLEGDIKGTIGEATAEVKAKFHVGKDDITAVANGKAMVAATEGKASGTINIFGLEIKGTIGGYAGAVGVEGKAGIENKKFVLKGGAAAVIGLSAGVEIGFNKTGWSNFVDFITFWD